MATERLIVKNFGPIKDIDIEVKDVNVLIGTTGSGKSTVAKLLAMFRSGEFLLEKDKRSILSKRLNELNIDFAVSDQTKIQYRFGNLFVNICKGEVESNVDPDEIILYFLSREDLSAKLVEKLGPAANVAIAIVALAAIGNAFTSKTQASKSHTGSYEKNRSNELARKISSFSDLDEEAKDKETAHLSEKYKPLEWFTESLYIPAERILISMIEGSIMGLLKNDVLIPECVKEFGSVFEKARKKTESLEIDFLDASYSFEDNTSFLTVDGVARLKLQAASSGFQSAVPLIVVLESIRRKSEDQANNFLVIEEPETNLYPTAQKKLTEFIIQAVNETNSELFITTHSPYILTALDNLVQAHNAFRTHPEKESEIEKIIPKSQWLDFDNVACYFFDKGTCRSTLNHELRTLGSSAIDEVSIEIGKEFDQLTDIQFA